jgi:chemosensory pili system protein ChpA (sensor histidine kinase/response regulator)
MSAFRGYDPGPLSWVNAEISQSLADATQQLALFAASPGDSATVKSAKVHLHQVAGALQMVGLAGAARFAEELENLTKVLEHKGPQAFPALPQLIKRGAAALGRFLDALLLGEANVPLRLLPLYRELLAARGVDKISASDLFFPDLTLLPEETEAPKKIAAREQSALFNARRSEYQRALLGWLRNSNDANSLSAMREALLGVQAAESKPAKRAFWSSAVALIECLLHKGLATDTAVKQLCGRVDLQIKRVAEGAESIAEPLFREVLYCVARSRSVSERVEKVKAAYRLDALLPVAGSEIEQENAELRQLLDQLRDLVPGVKDAWVQCTSGDRRGVTQFREQADRLAGLCEQLQHRELRSLIKKVAALAFSVNVSNGPISERLGVEMATALLLIESALESYSQLGNDFGLESSATIRRLSEAQASHTSWRPESGQPAAFDTLTQRAQEKRLLADTAQEMQINLRYIEQVLDGFFRDSNRRSDLPLLKPYLKQVHGALSILELRDAAALTKATSARIETWEQDLSPVPTEHADSVAEGISALSMYVSALRAGQADSESILEPVLVRWQILRRDDPLPVRVAATSVKHRGDLDKQKQNLAARLEQWKAQPDDNAVRGRLAGALEALREDAELNAELQVRDDAAEAMRSLDMATSAADADAARAVAAMLPQQAPPPGPSPDSERMAAAPKAKFDAEMLDLFLGEARDVVESIRRHLARCEEYPDDSSALGVIRRGYHTLKGSGRMVGLIDLAEAAWSVEQVLNQWLHEERAATPQLLELLTASRIQLSTHIERLKTEPAAALNYSAIAMHAEKLRRFPGQSRKLDAPAVSGSAALDASNDQSLIDRSAAGASDNGGAGKALSDASAAEIYGSRGVHQAVDESPAAASVSEGAVQPLSDASAARSGVPKGLVHLGSVTLSAEFYELYTHEAAEHVAGLENNCTLLRANPGRGVPAEFIRSAHTLTGISRTAGLMPIADLGYALELWLEAIKEQSGRLDPGQLALLTESADAIAQMVAAIRAKAVPAAANTLVIRLHESLDGIRSQRPRSSAVPPAPADATAFQPADPDISPSADSQSFETADSPSFQTAGTDLEIAGGAAAAEAPQISERMSDQAGSPGAKPSHAPLIDDLDPQLLPVFLDEADDIIPRIGSALREWRANPEKTQIANLLRRQLHTLKGSARMAGALRVGEVAHRLETDVAETQIRGALTSEKIDQLEAGVDEAVAGIEQLRTLPAPAAGAVAGVERLRSTQEPPMPSAPIPEPATAHDWLMSQGILRVRAELVERLANEAGEASITRSRIEGEISGFRQGLSELGDNVQRLRAQLREVEIQAESQLESRVSRVQESGDKYDPLEFDRYTRLQELTRFMAESVNDLATVQQGLQKNVEQSENALRLQARINRELQHALLGVRMVPLAHHADRLHRIVRQASKDLGKKARLEFVGARTELDRNVLERMTAPFEHLLRNAIAHGIESEAERKTAGKAEVGTIRIQARQEGNDILIAVSDDGAGLDLQRIRAKALQLGLAQAEQPLSDVQLTQMIFLPGFSTASEVTPLSGQGIGLDVVRNEVEALGGRLEVSWKRAAGTVFVIHLPVTLAVAQVVLVRAAGRTYSIPALIVEQVQQVKQKVLAALYQTRELSWLDKIVPFAYLPRLLGVAEEPRELMQQNMLLVLKSGALRCAIHVEEVLACTEVVVKTVGPQVARLPGIAGATVMGNGDIALILNPVALAHRGLPSLESAGLAASTSTSARAETGPIVMVVDDSVTVRKITSRLLAREGYQVVTAKDGLDALEKLLAIEPAVLLLDLEMPRMDGFELTRHLRADPKTAGIPIVVITSRSADKHRDHAKELGVDEYLGKPFQEQDLLAHVARYAAKSRRGPAVQAVGSTAP